MGQAHRPVIALALLVACSDDAASTPAPESTCKPFARPPPLSLRAAGTDGRDIVPPPSIDRAAFTDVRSVAADPVTGDIFVIDRTPSGDVLHRLRPQSTASRIDAPGTPLPLPADGAMAVVRDGRSWSLEGRIVYSANGSIVIVDPFGPSGPALATTYPFPGVKVLGVDRFGSALVDPQGVPSVLEDTSAPSIPSTLSATGCLDPTGAVAYDVAAPLWSDGAEKQRAVVLPPGGQARVLADGDLKFPKGTIAIKTFSRGGKKVETRLFVQHELDDWVGYSYAWNAAGTDADLVKGSAMRDGWYFPSSGDCNACHTPAAGFTLGLEARQLDDAAKSKLAPSSSAPRFTANDARAYLHANCSMCHREGSATGLAELDLRFDTPLERTGLCADPKVSTLDITGAKIVTPGAPDESVIVKRMRALDETRMPKLASHVVDEAGVALIETWVRSLPSCP